MRTLRWGAADDIFLEIGPQLKAGGPRFAGLA
jgi:hypothetical protein